jgi:prepilin-type processing-associated H-X9-DG protein
VVTSESDVQALTKGVKQLAKADLEQDLALDGITLRRPKEGVERFMITDINNPATSVRAQAAVPLLFESTARHPRGQKSGANVLYMDGHVEFIPQNGKFPVTDTVQRLLQSK